MLINKSINFTDNYQDYDIPSIYWGYYTLIMEYIAKSNIFYKIKFNLKNFKKALFIDAHIDGIIENMIKFEFIVITDEKGKKLSKDEITDKKNNCEKWLISPYLMLNYYRYKAASNKKVDLMDWEKELIKDWDWKTMNRKKRYYNDVSSINNTSPATSASSASGDDLPVIEYEELNILGK